MKALLYTPDGDGKAKIEEIPAELAEAAKAAHEALVEMIAEGDDELMAEFFEKGTLPAEDLAKGLRGAVLEKRIFPGAGQLRAAQYRQRCDFEFYLRLFPVAHRARKSCPAFTQPGRKGDAIERKIAESEPASLFVFKTVADPFAGRISYFKVMSGVVKNDANLTNFNHGTPERLQHVQVMQGKTAAAVTELHAGDIGAVAKLKDTTTSDSLGDKAAPIFYPARARSRAFDHLRVEPKTRADEDKHRAGDSPHSGRRPRPALRPRPANQGIPALRSRSAAH